MLTFIVCNMDWMVVWFGLLMWQISHMVITFKGSVTYSGYLPLLMCIFGNGICSFQVVTWTLIYLGLFHFSFFISKFMAFKLYFALFLDIQLFAGYIYRKSLHCLRIQISISSHS